MEAPRLYFFRQRDPASWDLNAARHLLNRGSFGGSDDMARTLFFMGQDGAVRSICEGLVEPIEIPSAAGDNPEGSHLGGLPQSGHRNKALVADELPPPPSGYGTGDDESESDRRARRRMQQLIQQQRLFSIQLPWLRQMQSVYGPHEKLVLFWHGMLTSGFSKVDNRPLMLAQNARLRRYAYGDYRVMVNELAIDPAMILYLDINLNRRRQPNENFARELLELFTLGEGNYDDTDIKELARIFINLNVDLPSDELALDPDDLPNIRASAGFNDRRKLIQRAIRKIFENPVCGQLLSRRLLEYYVTDEPESAWVDELSQILRHSGWNLRRVLRILFSSEVFYSRELRGMQIKSPVQFLLQGVADLGIKTLPESACQFAMRELGQSLFDPPNVAGWPGGKNWLNATTLAKRYELMQMLIDHVLASPSVALQRELAALPHLPQQTLDALIARLFPHDLPRGKRQALIAALPTLKDSPKSLVSALTLCPEYQLC